jgi:hypothetical protein
MLGSVNIGKQYDTAFKYHNKQAGRKRCMFSRMIDCIKFCVVFKLALLGHIETSTAETNSTV